MKEDYFAFEKEYNFDQMYFSKNNDIKLSEIYSKLKDLKSYEDKNFFKMNDGNFLSIQLKRSIYKFFYLDIFEKGEKEIKSKELLYNPSPLYLGFDGKQQIKLEIVSSEQFCNIPEVFKLKKPKLYCTQESKCEKFLFGQYLKHLKCKSKLLVYQDNSNLITLEEHNFNQIFNKKFPRDLIFKSPLDFEKHYSDYFEFKKNFKPRPNVEYNYYQLIERETFTEDIKSYKSIIDKLYFLYGKTGMGKSISIIKTLKYDYDHKTFGTLYINCKSMYKNYINNFDLLKYILKDEIPFLFENEYQKYKDCIYIINNYEINKMKTFWDLISSIIELCNNKEKCYIFAFDQYKDEFDQKGQLFELNNKLKGQNKYGILVCCSMNDKDVRKYKIEKLFKEGNLKYKADNMEIDELTFELNNEDFTIDKGGEFDQAFSSVGKTIKNYNELMQIKITNPNDLKKYLQTKKENIKNNLIDFYKIKDIEFQRLDKIEKILSFSGETEYELFYINSIIENIPFKYFDIQINNEKYGKIIYNFDLVKEVMGELYELLIYNHPSIYKVFNSNLLDNGALGGMYEKFVIYHMKPDISKHIYKNLFNYFKITKTYSVKKFIPNNNEKWEEKKFKKEKLSYGTYLFTQDNFNGKAFDAAIIDINTNNIAKTYLLQISINKKDIFSIEVLRKYLLLFKNYFERQFSFIIEEENIYFTYIFFTNNIEEISFDCNKNGMKCIFFNPSQKVFIDKNYFDLNYLNNIEEIFVSPFRRKKVNDIDIYMKGSNIQDIPINKINIQLTDEQFN